MTEAPLSPGRMAWQRFQRNRPAFLAAILLAATVLFLLLGPLVLGLSPTTVSREQFFAPDAGHWFGTDVHGRDLLARVCHGARISLLAGLAGTVVSLVIGVVWGAAAGYRGGRFDEVMMRIVDVLYSLPAVIFVIVLITTLEDISKRWLGSRLSPAWAGNVRLILLFAGLGAVSWLTMARIVRGQVLTLRTRAFVDASRALGAGHLHILRRHILPNIWSIVIVYLTLTMPSVILYESFLSYLGLGIQPPQASLGSLIAEGAAQLNPIRTHWWLIAGPGITLVGLLLALNYLGDGLRDALDVKGRE